MSTEFKDFDIDFEVKEQNGVPIIEGLAATFGNVDHKRDTIEQGAFKKSIRKRKPKMLLQHKQDALIGVWDSIKETSEGLLVKGRFIEGVQAAEEARILAKEGAIDSLSVGFKTKDFDINKKGIRVLKEIDLFEVSLVTFPADDQAKILSVKSLPDSIRDFEIFLRDAGYSRNEAKSIASRGFKQMDDQCDVGVGEQEILKSINQKLDVLTQSINN